jgi:hypothetical protein
VSDNQQCQAATKAGTACQAAVLPGRKWCHFHDPDRAAQRAADCRKAGKARSKPAAVLPPDTPDIPVTSAAEVVLLLARSINDVRKGALDPKVVNCISNTASVLLRALDDGELVGMVKEQARMIVELKTQVDEVRRAQQQASAQAPDGTATRATASHQNGVADPGDCATHLDTAPWPADDCLPQPG